MLCVFLYIIGKVLCCVCFCILLVRCFVVCVSAYYWYGVCCVCFCIVLVRCVLSDFVDIIGKVLCCVCFCIILVRC